MIKSGSGPLKDFSLRDAMRYVLCESEVNINTDQNLNQILDSSDWPSFGTPPWNISEEKWRNFLDSRDIRVAMSAKGPSESEGSMGPRGATMVPTKGAFDQTFIRSFFESNEALIDQSLASAGLAVGFPTTIFSDKRCALVDEIPTTPLRNFDKAGATQAIIDALASSSNPAAKELLTHRSRMLDANGQYKHFIAAQYMSEKILAVSKSCDSNPASVTNRIEDLYHLLQGKVASFRKLKIAEPFAMEMFYESSKLNAGEFDKYIGATINGKCELVVRN
jgi:hypothetical protein